MQVVPLALAPRLTVRSTPPLLALPGAASCSVLRPALSNPPPLIAVPHVGEPLRLLVKLLMATLPAAIDVQPSAVLVTNALLGAPSQYCASTWTGSATSCEPFALRMVSRPKRIGLPEPKAMPLPAVAVPKAAGLLAKATASVSITLSASAISALNGALGIVVLRVNANPVPDPNVSVPLPPENAPIAGSAVVRGKPLVSSAGVVPPPRASKRV